MRSRRSAVTSMSNLERDPRQEEAMALYWDVYGPGRDRIAAPDGIAAPDVTTCAKLRRMAVLHEAMARDRFAGDPTGKKYDDGWINLFMAITTRVDAADHAGAVRLFLDARRLAFGRPNADKILEEINRLERWVVNRRVPAIQDPSHANRC
jgi:hypothetical protein